jgi:hypothetical protein
LIKLHYLCHLAEDILEFGHPLNYIGHGAERSHKKFVKAAFARTDRGKTEKTKQAMLKRAAYVALLHQATFELEVAESYLLDSRLSCDDEDGRDVRLLNLNGVINCVMWRGDDGYQLWEWEKGREGHVLAFDDTPALSREIIVQSLGTGGFMSSGRDIVERIEDTFIANGNWEELIRKENGGTKPIF